MQVPSSTQTSRSLHMLSYDTCMYKLSVIMYKLNDAYYNDAY